MRAAAASDEAHGSLGRALAGGLAPVPSVVGDDLGEGVRLLAPAALDRVHELDVLGVCTDSRRLLRIGVLHDVLLTLDIVYLCL